MMFIFDYTLITSCLAAVFFSSLSLAKIDPFTFAFDCAKQTKLCAYGRIPKGRFARLLDSEGTCKVTASEQFMFMNEGESFAATRLIEKTKCPLAVSPSILYLDPAYKDSEFFKLTSLVDQKAKGKLLQLIKAQGLIKKSVNDKDQSGPNVPALVLTNLENSNPTISQINHDLWKDVNFISVVNSATKRGFLLAAIGDKTRILTGACGYPTSAQFFRINNKAFLRVKNAWCESDDSDEQIYQLKDQQFELVYSNDDLPSIED